METVRFAGAAFLLLVFGAAAHAARGEGKPMLERKHYEALGPDNGLFSHAVRHGDVLYLSGMTAFGTDAQGKGIVEQARAAFVRIRTNAEAEGTDLSSLVKVTIFVTGIKQAPLLRGELLRQYGDRPPASSMVEVSALFSPEEHFLNIEDLGFTEY